MFTLIVTAEAPTERQLFILIRLLSGARRFHNISLHTIRLNTSTKANTHTFRFVQRDEFEAK